MLLLKGLKINDLFMFVSSGMIYNYADDTSIYASDYKKEVIIWRTALLFYLTGFGIKSTKVIGEKCYLMFLSNVRSTSITIKMSNILIHESPEEKLLGVILDRAFSFKAHVASLRKKASQKLHALS